MRLKNLSEDLAISKITLIERFIRNSGDIINFTKIRKRFQKKINPRILKGILAELQNSGKIIYSPRGVQWIYTSPEHLKKLLEDGLEV